jgi:hypothetical protein
MTIKTSDLRRHPHPLMALGLSSCGGKDTTIPNHLPTLVTAIADASTNEDAAYSYDASANFTDVNVGDTLTYSATLANGSEFPSVIF